LTRVKEIISDKYAIVAKNFVNSNGSPGRLAKFRDEEDSDKHNDLCPLSRFW